MRYEGDLYRPPSEANALILQATIGCSWNHCTYCAMYRGKDYRERDLDECLEDLEQSARQMGSDVRKLFVADGDALALPMESWRKLLEASARLFPKLRRVSCYATAQNLLGKSPDDLAELRAGGLRILYIGPESGDDTTLKRISKGASFAQHVEAAKRAHQAGMELSMIALLGAGGVDRSQVHAEATGRLVTAMDPEFFSALTLNLIPGTTIEARARRGRFVLPSESELLAELRTMLEHARPRACVFRSNHASNALPLAGRLPRDTERLLGIIDGALAGEVGLRPGWMRGL